MLKVQIVETIHFNSMSSCLVNKDFCLPNSADYVMDRVKNHWNVFKCTLKAQVDFTSCHGAPFSADLAKISKHCFIFKLIRWGKDLCKELQFYISEWTTLKNIIDIIFNCNIVLQSASSLTIAANISMNAPNVNWYIIDIFKTT